MWPQYAEVIAECCPRSNPDTRARSSIWRAPSGSPKHVAPARVHWTDQYAAQFAPLPPISTFGMSIEQARGDEVYAVIIGQIASRWGVIGNRGIERGSNM